MCFHSRARAPAGMTEVLPVVIGTPNWSVAEQD